MGREWGPTPLVDQARAGIVLVLAGVALLVTVVVVTLVRLRGGPRDPHDPHDRAPSAEPAVVGADTTPAPGTAGR